MSSTYWSKDATAVLGSVRDEQYRIVPDTAIGISRGHWGPIPGRSGREMTKLGEERIIWEARERAAGLFARAGVEVPEPSPVV